jgi:hypothetical protein
MINHPAVSCDPQVLCAAERACKAWRETVQQSGACNTAVVFDPKLPLQQLTSVAQWLPRHAALVKSITATAAVTFDCLGEIDADWEFQLKAAQQLLQDALQNAAQAPSVWTTDVAAAAAAEAAPPPQTSVLKPAAPAPSLLTAATAEPASTADSRTTDMGIQQQQQQQQQGWRLASFSSNLPKASALLPVLPAHSLTHLDLELLPGAAAEQAAADLKQLARLSSLRELSLTSRVSRAGKLAPFLPIPYDLSGIAQLSSLTALTLAGSWKDISKAVHQLLQQPLPLHNAAGGFS